MVTNLELAALFGELAALTRIADGSAQSFRARAYEAAAKTLEGLPTGAAALSETELRKLPGIGKATAAKVREYADSGRIAKLEQLREEYPPEFRALVDVPGLGPKRAVLLRDALGVGSTEDLAAALEAEAVRELPGFGERTEANLRRAVRRLGLSGKERRTPILVAMREAEWLLAEVRAIPGVAAAAYCGSLRRFRDTVADLDILVGDRRFRGGDRAAGEPGLDPPGHRVGRDQDLRCEPVGPPGGRAAMVSMPQWGRPFCTSPVRRPTTYGCAAWPSGGGGCSTSTP